MTSSDERADEQGDEQHDCRDGQVTAGAITPVAIATTLLALQVSGDLNHPIGQFLLKLSLYVCEWAARVLLRITPIGRIPAAACHLVHINRLTSGHGFKSHVYLETDGAVSAAGYSSSRA
jgi:hypothetical protein